LKINHLATLSFTLLLMSFFSPTANFLFRSWG
jgi:hypothetical protein